MKLLSNLATKLNSETLGWDLELSLWSSAASGRLRLKEGKPGEETKELRMGPRMYVANMPKDNHHEPNVHDLCDGDDWERRKEKAISQMELAV